MVQWRGLHSCVVQWQGLHSCVVHWQGLHSCVVHWRDCTAVWYSAGVNELLVAPSSCQEIPFQLPRSSPSDLGMRRLSIRLHWDSWSIAIGSYVFPQRCRTCTGVAVWCGSCLIPQRCSASNIQWGLVEFTHVEAVSR